MLYLRQSTAVTLKFGPFVDAGDAVTEETGLTIAQADIRLSKNGANIIQSNNAAGAPHDELGYYNVPLDATDTDALGTLLVAVHDNTTYRPVTREYSVIPANVYDSMFNTDKLQVDLVQIDGLTTADRSAVLGLKQLNILNTSGSAIIAHSTGGDGDGIQAIGEGIGSGISGLAGADGSGISALGLTDGYGIDVRGGGNSGAGIRARAIANNDAGMELVKHNTGKDLDADEIGDNAAATLVDTNELQGDWTNGGRLDLLLDAILANTQGLTFQKNTSFDNFMFPLVDSNGTGLSGKTITAQRILDNGSLESMAASFTEVGSSGIYRGTLSAADVNCDSGVFIFSSNSPAVPRPIYFKTVV